MVISEPVKDFLLKHLPDHMPHKSGIEAVKADELPCFDVSGHTLEGTKWDNSHAVVRARQKYMVGSHHERYSVFTFVRLSDNQLDHAAFHEWMADEQRQGD